jgi:hypothetical protein
MTSPRRIIFLLLFFVSFFLLILQPVYADKIEPLATKTDYSILAGKWQRTDGNYLIKVSDVQERGQAAVEYFNPRSIRVVQTTISTEKELIKLFIKFQDKGYEGSTYSLYYYAEKDALLGFYYQAPMDKTYEVIFLRKAH